MRDLKNLAIIAVCLGLAFFGVFRLNSQSISQGKKVEAIKVQQMNFLTTWKSLLHLELAERLFSRAYRDLTASERGRALEILHVPADIEQRVKEIADERVLQAKQARDALKSETQKQTELMQQQLDELRRQAPMDYIGWGSLAVSAAGLYFVFADRLKQKRPEV